MFNIGAGEMMFIMVAALLILGPQRLPELARGIGKFLREFRRQTDDVRTVVVREFYQMDQELQREPAPPVPPTPVPPVPEAAPALHAALPAPSEVPATLEAGAAAHPPEPVAMAGTAEPPPEGAPADAPVTPGEAGPEKEEGVPRFAPIPGTVARNAPKQS